MGDFQTVALWGVSVACTVLGWFARELWSAVNKLKQDLQSLALEINEKYVRKDDFASFRTELLDFMRRIEDKLDRKVDK